MRKLLIDGEWYFAEDDDTVLNLVDTHMGHDTVDALREIIDNANYCGDCDENINITKRYQRIIQGAIKELEAITVPQKHEARLKRLLRALNAEL